MNVVFTNKLASDCFHTMARDPSHRESLIGFIDRFTLSSWLWDQSERIMNIPIRKMARYEKSARPASSGITGFISECHISVCPNDAYLVDMGWHTREFDFIVWAYEVDTYGQKIESTRSRVINGAFINHSRSETDPSWSMHT